MIARPFRKAQDGLAVGTLAVDVSFTVAEFVALEFEKALNGIPYLEEFLILRAAAVDVSGHHTHDDGDYHDKHKDGKRKASDECVDERDYQIKYQKQ